MLIISIAMASILLTGHALANPVKPATLALAQPAEPVESAVPELAKIVVLCAEEEEEKFKAEWSKYVKHHDLKDSALQKTIREVSESASAQRSAERSEIKSISDEEKWKAERRSFMNEVAREIFGPNAQ